MIITPKLILLTLHIIGVALGAGGATMSDMLFLTSISDNQIDQSELKLLKIASRIVVVGLILLMVTGAGFFLFGAVESDRFWAKMTIVSIATLNGIVMHNVAFPIFERCAKYGTKLMSAEFTRHAPLLVTAGTVSALSWYAALILGMWRTLTLSYAQIIMVYGGVVIVSVVGANIMVQLGLRYWHKLPKTLIFLNQPS